MKDQNQKTIRNQSGQGLVEYLIIVALIAVSSMIVMRSLGQTINVQFGNVINSLQGKNKRQKHQAVDERHFKRKDLGNFMNGAASKDD